MNHELSCKQLRTARYSDSMTESEMIRVLYNLIAHRKVDHADRAERVRLHSLFRVEV